MKDIKTKVAIKKITPEFIRNQLKELFFNTKDKKIRDKVTKLLSKGCIC